jgi:hypothetical protein
MTSESERFCAMTEKKALKNYLWLARVILQELVPF